MKLLVTGGCGYKGSVLIPLLLADGHSVISIDTQWFGNALPEHPQLTNLKLDVRDTDAIPLDGVEAILGLRIVELLHVRGSDYGEHKS